MRGLDEVHALNKCIENGSYLRCIYAFTRVLIACILYTECTPYFANNKTIVRV